MLSDFDIASTQYDAVFTFSEIGKAQRRMVFKYVKPLIHIKDKLSVLELNCGTGEDAIRFAQSGHDVLATDISEGMIKIASAKANSKNLSFKNQDINTLNKNAFDKKFDFIFSNFGGFNCLSKHELEVFFATASQLLNPKGKIVLVIMPKHCLWEQFYFSLKGNFKTAKRRKTETSVLANVDGINVETWYYNPKDIVSLVDSDYDINKIKPIGVAIPPSYLEGSFLANELFISIYKGIDNLLTGKFWAKYADHFLIEITKK